MAQGGLFTFRMSHEEDLLLRDAAGIASLSKSDLIRLALNRALTDLYSIASKRAAFSAQRFFLKKAYKRWGCPFQQIDFASEKVQAWLVQIENKDDCPNDDNVGNNQKTL